MATEYDITRAFQAIETELINSMIRNMARHRAEEDAEGFQWSMWQAEQLKSLEKYKKAGAKKYGKQFSSINKQIGTLLRQAHKTGSMEQEEEILKAIRNGFMGRKSIRPGMTAEFFKLNERKLEALIQATTNDMKKAETAILRMANDQYRKAIFNAQVYANTGTGTYEKAVDMATKDMLAAGLNCVQYANGARHTLADYADMALRTASKRAYLQGEGQMRQEWGIYTVIVNKRGNPCPKCLPHCGKVYIDDVWSGGPKSGISPVTGRKYPLMSKAIAGGLYHPRCKDSHTTYFEGISTTPAGSKYTRKELNEIADRCRGEQQQKYAERQAEKYGRMANFSLDPENQEKYAAKARQWTSTAAIHERKAVKYNPESEYSVEIPGLSKEVNNGLSAAAEELAKLGSRDGHEHMYLIDLNTGLSAFYETNQDPHGVGYDFWDVVLKNPDRKFAFVHNHNIISSLSETDLTTIATTQNIHAMIAVQNDGVIYYVQKKKQAPKGFWPDVYFEDSLKFLNESVRNGIIMPYERTRKREEIIIECMIKEFFGEMVIIDGRKL